MDPGDDVQLRPARPEEVAWVEALVSAGATAPSLSTGAATGLAGAAAAGELLVAETAGAPVGAVVVATVNRRSRIAAISTLVVDPAARGRGLGAAILRAAARDAFARGVHRVQGEVYGFNGPALRAFAAAGFVREGVRRRAYERHGEWQDGVCFGLLADD